MAFEFSFKKREELHTHSLVEYLLIYLSFLKIIHHCSSQLGSNSKGIQKINSKTQKKLIL